MLLWLWSTPKFLMLYLSEHSFGVHRHALVVWKDHYLLYLVDDLELVIFVMIALLVLRLVFVGLDCLPLVAALSQLIYFLVHNCLILFWRHDFCYQFFAVRTQTLKVNIGMDVIRFPFLVRVLRRFPLGLGLCFMQEVRDIGRAQRRADLIILERIIFSIVIN